jgi:hypothetical protein
MNKQKESRVGLGCLILFALPFAGFGLFALFKALSNIFSSNPDWSETIPLLVAGSLFSLVGVGLILGGIAGLKQQKKQEELQLRNPESPWLWREGWASGRIKSKASQGMIGLWVFTVIWNAVSIPVSIIIVTQEIGMDNKIVFVVLLFPLVGIITLFFALKETFRWKKFGVSIFEMQTLPGVIGGKLEGMVHTSIKQQLDKAANVRLSCVNRIVSGSGKNRSTSERILWQTETTLERGTMPTGYKGLIVPVAFEIPSNCRETDSSNPRNSILWRLKIDAAVPGLDYKGVFEIPVFRTDKTVETESTAKDYVPLETQPVTIPDHYEPTKDLKVKVRPSMRGGMEFYFPAARHIGAAIGTSVFFIIWSAAVFAMYYFSAPLFFTIIFGLVNILLFLGVVQMWFGSNRVIVEDSQVKLIAGMLFIKIKTETPCFNVEDVNVVRGMQVNQELYNDIQLRTKDGKKYKIGKSIKDRRDAEWIVRQMMEQIVRYQ